MRPVRPRVHLGRVGRIGGTPSMPASTMFWSKNVFRREQIETGGGGGTAMAAMIVGACDGRPSPKAILVVTDGYTGCLRATTSCSLIICWQVV